MQHPQHRNKNSARLFALLLLVCVTKLFVAQTIIKDSLEANKLLGKHNLLKQQSSDMPNNFIPEKDSFALLFISQKTKIPQTKISKPNNIKKCTLACFKSKGNISLGYEYGWLPFANTAAVPIGNYKTEGEIEFVAFNFPLRLNFFYSDIKYNTGINNHFKLSYDINAYKDEMRKKIIEEQKGLKEKLNNNLSHQKLIEEELLSLEHMKRQIELKKNINIMPELNISEKIIPSEITKLQLPDTTGLMNSAKSLIPVNPMQLNDSIQSELANRGAVLKDSSTNKIESVKSKIPYDSLTGQINTYKTQLNDLKATANETKEKIEKLDGFIKNPSSIGAFTSKKDKFISGIKKLEFGLCYPSYSTFLVSNMPVKGINIQYEKNEWITAFTYGTTVNTLLFTPDPVRNLLENTKNLYNFFDFNNVEAGRKIIAAKTGFGSKEKTHFYLGFLYGLGSNSYINNDENYKLIRGREQNTVIEVDAKYELNKNHSFDLIYGKSSIRDLTFLVEEYNNTIDQLTGDFRSNAAILRYNGYISKTKTKITVSSRIIDPFFRSFGVAYMRSDNLRHELKFEQPYKSKFKYTMNLRYDEDNLLNLYQYKTRMYTWGNNLQYKISKRTTIRVAYNPVLQNIKTGETTITDNNSITNVVLTYIPKTKNISMQNTGVYSYYNLTTDSQQINFQNVMFSQQVQFRNGFRSGLTSSWYKNNLTDSLSNNSIISVLEGGYTSKKGNSISVAGKAALFKMHELQGGFSLKGGFKIYKKLAMELQIERLVVGEFYNTYNIQNGLSNFPYYSSAKLTYKW